MPIVPTICDITFHSKAKPQYYTIDLFRGNKKVSQIGGKYETYEEAYDAYEWTKKKFYGKY